ncbi:hypothetical protein HGA34_02845 [Candidatus Falkowbacteria bacterium]|nr:hypothetical protein [Candidatus Falkowbacteria bacterium]
MAEKKFLKTAFVFISFFFFALVSTASAATCAPGVPVGTGGCTAAVVGTGGQGTGGAVSLTPAVNVGTPQQFIGKIINTALGVVGSLALLMFIYGGFTWLTSAGSADKVTKGKNILVWAVIGLVVIFMSYGATKFVLDKITAT